MKSKRIILTIILAIITALSMGCAGMQVKNPIETGETIGARGLGYYVGQHYADKQETILKFIDEELLTSSGGDLKTNLDLAVMYLTNKLSDDPFVQMVVITMLESYTIEPGVPISPDLSERIKKDIRDFRQWFVIGVKVSGQAVLPVTPDVRAEVEALNRMMDKVLDEVEITTFGYIAG